MAFTYFFIVLLILLNQYGVFGNDMSCRRLITIDDRPLRLKEKNQLRNLFEAYLGDSVRLRQDEFSNLVPECSGDDAKQLYRWIEKVYQTVYKKRIYQKQPLNVVVIGAGPVGLLSAIEAYQSGANVAIVEKRNQYTRNVWFDIYPKPYSPGYDVLHDLGFEYASVEYESQKLDKEDALDDNTGRRKDEVITVRCKILEQFLERVIVMLPEIDMFYGLKYLESVACGNKLCALISNDQKETKSLIYDIIIGADGTKSEVRNSFNVSFDQMEVFDISNTGSFHNVTKTLRVDDIHQTALIVNFKSENGSCPMVKKDDFGKPIDPWSPGFVIDGISSVFKRFYHGHCHLQILFLKELGDNLHQSYISNDKQPLFEVLFQVSNYIFQEQYSNIDELKDSIHLEEVLMWNIRIFRSKYAAVLLSEPEKIPVVGLLVGDAAVTAHFRLGIGINNAFWAYDSEELLKFLSDFHSINLISHGWFEREKFKSVFTDMEDKALKRMHSMIQYQLSTIFYESHCNFYVFPDSKNYQAMYIYQRKSNQYVPFATADDMLKTCFENIRQRRLKGNDSQEKETCKDSQLENGEETNI